jgi:hypothetical protein
MCELRHNVIGVVVAIRPRKDQYAEFHRFFKVSRSALGFVIALRTASKGAIELRCIARCPPGAPTLGTLSPPQRCHPEAAPRAAEGSAVAFSAVDFLCAPATRKFRFADQPDTTRKNGLDARIGLISLVEANYYLRTLPELPHYVAATDRHAASLEWRGDQAS